MSFDLTVIHRDEWLIVLDKPGGLLSVPGRGPENRRNLASLVQEAYPMALNVHRLDRDTSGLIVMALDAWTHRRLSDLFAARLVQKGYLAIVAGELPADEGVIELPLAKDFANPPRHRVDHERGRPAVTRFQVLARQGDRSRIRLEPLTGRSHQLRVHLQAIDHAILGDPLYGDPRSPPALRLMLHAEQLAFAHPRTGAPMNFSSPCPF